LNVKPKFGGVGTKAKDISPADVLDVLNTNPSDLFAELAAKFSSRRNKLTAEQYKQNVESTCAFLLFILTGSLSMAYFVTFKTYHTSLDKMESLKELLSNPNARVATREQGARIMEIVNKHQE